MGNDGKVDCSICMDELELGAEVAVLPCNHYFHHPCIESWLKLHDTCPVCRKPIQDRDLPSSSSSSSSPRLPRPDTSQPSSLNASPSRIRESRRQYFSNRTTQGGEDLNRSQSHRSSPAQSSTSPENGGSANNSSNPTGPLDWVRSHLPFGG